MGIKVGIGGATREVSALHVGIGGVVHKVDGLYTDVDGVRRIISINNEIYLSEIDDVNDIEPYMIAAFYPGAQEELVAGRMVAFQATTPVDISDVVVDDKSTYPIWALLTPDYQGPGYFVKLSGFESNYVVFYGTLFEEA